MLDQEDEGARIGVWVALGVVFLVLTMLVGGLAWRAVHRAPHRADAAHAALPMHAATAAHAGTNVSTTVGAAGGSVAGAVAGAVSAAAHSVAHAASAVATATGDAVENLLDEPLRGERLAKIYFDLASSKLPVNASSTLEKAVRTLADQPQAKLILSGFHDASGDPVKNAELAKQRAISTRAALIAAGADPARVLLRKPAVVEGGADAQEARRVEMRLVKS